MASLLILSSLLTVGAAILTTISPSLSETIFINVSTQDLAIELDDNSSFSAILSAPSQKDFIVEFTYKNDILDLYPYYYTVLKGTDGPLNFTVHAKEAGHATLQANTTENNTDTEQAFVRISIFKVGAINTISTIIGWLYFIAWSVSFYPQIISNWRRKSVIGLNFDFLALNISGFVAYSIFNVGLYFVPKVQDEYLSIHPTGLIPVEVNDVVFALHAAFATAITIFQCFCYERGNQIISRPVILAVTSIWAVAGILLIVTAQNWSTSTPWLTFLYYFSYVKLGVTLVKYIPQVYYNFTRKSTKGWSIGTVLWDFTGGIFSILQMFLNAYNYNDWYSIFGNFTKFGLGMASVFFDVVFITQHYCLYTDREIQQPLLHRHTIQ